MDRSRKITAVGLCLAPFLIAPGCAKMQSMRSAPAPAVLGVARVDNNYSAHHGPAPSIEAASLPQLADIEILPPGALAVEEPRPEQIEVMATSSRLVSANQGVPDASRLLATANQRRDPEAAPGHQLDVAEMVAEARVGLDRTTSYQAAMHRQERVGNALLPAEDLILSVRRNPRAVRLSWTEGPHQGREAIYRVDGDGLMHVNMARLQAARASAGACPG